VAVSGRQGIASGYGSAVGYDNGIVNIIIADRFVVFMLFRRKRQNTSLLTGTGETCYRFSGHEKRMAAGYPVMWFDTWS